MTPEEIAREIMREVVVVSIVSGGGAEVRVRIAAAIREERERCAKIAERATGSGLMDNGRTIAAAIRKGE
jgi:hypothetical protein